MYRKNTASQFVTFQLISTTDGSVVTGATVAVRRCIDGTFGDGGGTVTEDGTNGSYKYAMAQADTNGNNISLRFSATGAIAQVINFVTTAANPTDSVRFGLTALPNAAADAAGGLPISDAGGLDLDAQIGTDIDAILVDTGTTLQAELDAIQAAVITNAAGTDVAADIIALKAVADAILVDTGTTLDGRIPAALTAGGNMKSDMLAISGDTGAADNLEEGATGVITSTCAASATTTSIPTNLTEATDDHYNGRVITFVSGDLLGQSSSISDYNGTTKTLTVVALTEAPAENDVFVIS